MGNITVWMCVVLVVSFFQKTDGFLPSKCSGSDVITCVNQTYITPRGFPPSMTELHISSSTIDNLQKDLLRTLTQKCPNLRVFKIKSSVIKYIHSCSFSSVSNFDQIVFQDSRVQMIVRNAFSDLQSVQNIEFINVQIEEISMIAFHQIRDVGRLTMDNMTVNILRYASFAELEDVKQLQLTNSYINVFEQQPIVNQQSISAIEFRGNTINSTLCGLDSLFQSGLVFANNNLTCNSEMAAVLATSANNKCRRNVTEKCPPLKDTNVLKHSYDCQAVLPDEGIRPVSEEEVFDIDSKGNNHAMSSLYGAGYLVFTTHLSLAFSIVLFYYM